MSSSLRPYGLRARQAPLSMGFSRQEYWSRLPCPPPEALSNPGTEPMSLVSPALAGSLFTTSATTLQLRVHIVQLKSLHAKTQDPKCYNKDWRSCVAPPERAQPSKQNNKWILFKKPSQEVKRWSWAKWTVMEGTEEKLNMVKTDPETIHSGCGAKDGCKRQ